MREYYFSDPILLEDININSNPQNTHFYLINSNEGHSERESLYKLCALSLDYPLTDPRITFDPETRVKHYWPITREQIDLANKNILFSERLDGEEKWRMRVAPFTGPELQAAFNFDSPFNPLHLHTFRVTSQGNLNHVFSYLTFNDRIICRFNFHILIC